MTYIFFACGAVMFLFAITQFLSSGKESGHNYMAIAPSILGCQMIYFWAAEARMLERVPALAGIHVPLTLLAVPAFYVSAMTILRGGARPDRRLISYFALPLLFALGFGAYRFTEAGRAIPRSGGPVFGYFEYPWSFRAIVAIFVLMIAWTLVSAHRMKKGGKAAKSDSFRIQIAFLRVYLAEMLLILASCLLASDRFLAYSVAAFGLTAAAFTLTCTGIVFFSRKIPIASLLKAPSGEAWDDEDKALSLRIEKLMDESAPYKDSELTLEKLARMLRIEPKELSRFFNSRLDTTFRGYINERRLRAAGESLVDNPGASILDTAFENGFNSKTSFNTLFAKAYGMSPRDYRAAKLSARHKLGTPR